MTDSHKTEIVPTSPGDIQRMHPMVGAAMAAGTPDPATLEKLMDLQQRWERGEAKKAFTAAMVGLKRDLPAVIGHDKKVDFKTSKGRTCYTHASLAATVEAVVGILAAHGFTHKWVPKTSDSSVEVTCTISHRAGHHEECTIDSPPDTGGLKNAAQARMSTITMLSRYSLLSLLGLATGDMSEPTGEQPDPEGRIVASRNLKAAAAIKAAGNTIEDAERLVGGRKVSEWTVADLRTLRAWLDGEILDGEEG